MADYPIGGAGERRRNQRESRKTRLPLRQAAISLANSEKLSDDFLLRGPDFQRFVDESPLAANHARGYSKSGRSSLGGGYNMPTELSELRDFLKNAPRFFVCNTNRRRSPDGMLENLMRRAKHAICWNKFNWPSHMERVLKGDAIFMYAKDVGIIAVGRASRICKVVAVGRPGRLDLRRPNVEEWQVPVDDWLVWIENDEEACYWRMPVASFLDVSADTDAYRELRERVLNHFCNEH
jgi:hypothetical protein